MVIFAAHVKQAALVGIGHGGRTKVKRPLHRGQQRCPVELNRIKRTGFDQGLHRALVDLAAVYPHAKIKQTLERPHRVARRPSAAPLARRHNRLDCLLACALDGAQTVANLFVRDRLKAAHTPVHIRRLKGEAHLQGVFKQHFQLVGVVHLHRHVGAEKLGGVMHLEPAGVVRQQRVSSCV